MPLLMSHFNNKQEIITSNSNYLPTLVFYPWVCLTYLCVCECVSLTYLFCIVVFITHDITRSSVRFILDLGNSCATCFLIFVLKHPKEWQHFQYQLWKDQPEDKKAHRFSYCHQITCKTHFTDLFLRDSILSFIFLLSYFIYLSYCLHLTFHWFIYIFNCFFLF